MRRAVEPSVLRRVVRACYAATGDVSALRLRFLAELRRVVPIDAAFFAATDPETLLFTFAAADEPLAREAPRFLDHEMGAAPDVNRFSELARARSPVATLDDATQGQRGRSARFRDIIAPLGLGDELRVALRVDGATWGFLCLHREGRFRASEVGLLRQLAPHAGEAIRRTVAEAIASDSDAHDAAGVVIVTCDVVTAISDRANVWLDDGGLRVRVGESPPLLLRALLRRLEATERGPIAETASLRLRPPRGPWLEVHASRLRGDDDRTVAITLAPARASALAGLRLAAYQLTPAQRRVADCVLRGMSTRQIAGELEIASHTVQDHLKAVFDKVGVQSRRELVATLRSRG